MPQQPRLADEFWLSAHDSLDGLSQLRDFPLGIGLGTALLAELLQPVPIEWTDPQEGHRSWRQIPLVQLRGDELFLTPEVPWNVDDTLYELLVFLCDEIQSLPRHGDVGVPVGQLLTFLAGSESGCARDLLEGPMNGGDYTKPRTVGHRSIAHGRLTRGPSPMAKLVQRRQGLLRIHVHVHVPISGNHSAAPAVRIQTRVRRQEPLNIHDGVLAALHLLTDLDERVFSLDARESGWLEGQLPSLPPEMGGLIFHAQSLIGDKIMR